MFYPEDSVFVTGTAKVSKDDVVNAMYQSLSLCLIIDIHSNQILQLDCTMVLSTTTDFIRGLLVGKNIISDIEEITYLMQKRFLGMSQKAILAALHDAQNRYLMAYPNARTT